MLELNIQTIQNDPSRVIIATESQQHAHLSPAWRYDPGFLAVHDPPAG
jgi:hypothetical protein